MTPETDEHSIWQDDPPAVSRAAIALACLLVCAVIGGVAAVLSLVGGR